MVAGVDGVFIAAVMGADVMMIFGGFMSTITDGHIKWIWFCLSLIVFFPVVFVSHPHVLNHHSNTCALALGPKHGHVTYTTHNADMTHMTHTARTHGTHSTNITQTWHTQHT